MNIERVYFIGIGGIGMSALARYFMHEGKAVAGYDRTQTELTLALESEGATVCYQSGEEFIPEAFRDRATTLVVYTPAVATTHAQYVYFEQNGFEIVKRSKMLGVIAKDKYVMAVAGTHGKTSTTSMLAYFNSISSTSGSGSAFLGGIAKNFKSNMVLGDGERLAVEADEFDRSFLQLYPNVAVITSCDADHLDIYGTHEAVKQAFASFASQIKADGALVLKQGVELDVENKDITIYRYSYDDSASDFYATNIKPLEGGYYNFDMVSPFGTLADCRVGIPGWINVENAIAAAALLLISGCHKDKLREAMAGFSGVLRRFDFHINRPDRVYMNDYAHHPRELTAAITSVRKMFPKKKLTVMFQPHLYTRTRDFHAAFAEALSLCDDVLLMPIYPARELPIEGVSSQMIAKDITVPVAIVEKQDVLNVIEAKNPELFVSFGAGDIDCFCDKIAEKLQ
ncbi:MAG: UDP-N-acetylmuramate--L-alanine ligase [Rikenellaceae bacterium]